MNERNKYVFRAPALLVITASQYAPRHALHVLVGLALLFLLLSTQPVMAAPFDVSSAQGVLQRVLPDLAAHFELRAVEARAGSERFRISAVGDHIQVEGSTPSALLFGVNWYLKYVAHVQISPEVIGFQLDISFNYRRLSRSRRRTHTATPSTKTLTAIRHHTGTGNAGNGRSM